MDDITINENKNNLKKDGRNNDNEQSDFFKLPLNERIKLSKKTS